MNGREWKSESYQKWQGILHFENGQEVKASIITGKGTISTECDFLALEDAAYILES